MAVFQVFHHIGSDRHTRFSERAFAGWPADYTKVADVDAPALGAVFGLTNHIDSSWLENAGVRPVVSSARSTSVGDVIVDAAGKAHGVAGIGFREL